MAAPTLSDGISRAIEEIAVPSIGLLVLIAVIRETYGGQEAGIAYVLSTGIILLGIYTAAKYWNIKYTLGFVVAGVVTWGGIPGVMPHLVPSLFANLGKLIVLCFLISVALMLTDKW